MSRTATYHTTVKWTGNHWGHLAMGNGPEMKFSAPPDAEGHAGVFTPEDAFVAAANTCLMLMFIWATERFKLKLLSYECRTEGTKLIELDRTEIFTRLLFRPRIRVATGSEPQTVVEARVRRALQSARKYSLVANSVKSEVAIEPEISVVSERGRPSVEGSGMASDKKRVLVLCTGNSCRSQMAEGWVNHLLGERWEARSAGTAPAARLHPLAVRAMAEVGVDISGGQPEHVGVYLDQPWDLVVTVCDSAREVCPTFPRPVPKLHISFFDPAAAEGTDDEKMAVFRRVRDEIRDRLVPEVRSCG